MCLFRGGKFIHDQSSGLVQVLPTRAEQTDEPTPPVKVTLIGYKLCDCETYTNESDERPAISLRQTEF
jgi:hypothetical protein